MEELLFAKILFYYCLTDVMSGVYHFLTDKGYNIRRQVLEFREHHDNPDKMTIDWKPVLASLPLLVLGLWHSDFFIIGCCVGFIQFPHWMTHRKWDNAFLRFMRWTGVFISPKQHNAHHDGVFDKNYCVVTSWNNWWFNKLVSYIPLKERAVT